MQFQFTIIFSKMTPEKEKLYAQWACYRYQMNLSSLDFTSRYNFNNTYIEGLRGAHEGRLTQMKKLGRDGIYFLFPFKERYAKTK